MYLNGKEVGFTPFQDSLVFDQGQTYRIECHLREYEPRNVVVAYDPPEQTDYYMELPEVTELELELVDYQIERGKNGVRLQAKPRKTLSLKEVIERSPNVASVGPVTNYEDPTLSVGGPVLSPDGKQLVYSVTVREEGDRYYSNIWRQSIGSNTRTKVTSGRYGDIDPVFDPEGNYIFFSSNRNTDRTSLWRIASSGAGGITKITGAASEDYQPTAGRDLVVFTSNVRGAEWPQIWTARKDGSLMTQLREGHSPHLSPDGSTILFVREDSHTSKEQIWTMTVGGSDETLLSPSSDVREFDARWAPDGKGILFTSDEGKDSRGKRNFDIWLMRADGSERTQLTTNGSQDDKPCFDPAGEYIYFRSNRGFKWNLWRFKLSQPRQ